MIKDAAGLGRKMCYARQAADLTQGQAATAIGKSTSWLSMVEAGQRSVNAELLWKIAELYGCQVAFFFGETINEHVESKQLAICRNALLTIKGMPEMALSMMDEFDNAHKPPPNPGK